MAGFPYPGPSPRVDAATNAVLVVGAACAVTTLFAASLGHGFGPGHAYLLLMLTAAGVTVGTAVVAEFTVRLADDLVLARIGAAAGVYGLSVIPVDALSPPPGGALTLHAASGVDAGGVMALLALAVMACVRDRAGTRRTSRVWPATLLVLALLAVTTLVLVSTSALTGIVVDRLDHGVLATDWAAAAAVLVTTGLLTRRPLVWQTGCGIALIALAHTAFHEIPASSRELMFAALQLLGAVVVLGAVVARARTALVQHRIQLVADECRLRATESAVQSAAEREHEIRNGLAGVASAASLLAAGTPGVEQVDRAELAAALQAELLRMHMLLDGAQAGAEPSESLLEPVLRRLIVLRRAAGAQVDLTVEPGLRIPAPALVLAQVMTNLLANCDRHAPGAPVHVSARQRGDVVRLVVRDEGPGIPPGAELTVLERGVHDPAGAGSGLGLHVCAALAEEHGGDLRLVPRSGDRPGCTVVLELPARK
ncbi:MAG TPA: sensor histidine kinase [Pseudonocardiaceae bacterium]|jgi:two-component system OmpR family sensor kinase|nr:sensor histidine kinase [Pseudonocardiaceae bacterium]